MFPFLSPVPSLLSVSAIVVILISICIFSFTLLLLFIGIVIFYMILDYFQQNCQSHESDVESGEDQLLHEPDITYDNVEWYEQATFYQAAVLHNLRVLEILDRVIEELEERKERRKRRERQRDLEKKLPPRTSYGSHESGILMGKDCAICLEEFETGEMCQPLSSCGHAFHHKCIYHWLRESLTCPICRRPVIEL